MTAHPRLPDGPCPDYERGLAALPGKGPAEIRAEMIASGDHVLLPDGGALAVEPKDDCEQDGDPFEGIPNADDQQYELLNGLTSDEQYREDKSDSTDLYG
jgi:hypothetical protein